jgi:hypothetical protein
MFRLKNTTRLILIASFLAQAAFAESEPNRTIAQIDWKAAELAKHQAGHSAEGIAKRLAVNSGKEWSNTKLPLLAVGNETGFGVGRFAGQGTAYAITYTLERAKLSVLGSATTIVAAPDAKFEHETTHFEFIGDGADYSFTRFGAAYTLRLACDEPLTDKRCTAPDYLTGIANDLIVAGGNP